MGMLMEEYYEKYLRDLEGPHDGRVAHPAVWISEEWEIRTQFLIQADDAEERLRALEADDKELCKCVVAGMNMRMDAMFKDRLPTGRMDYSDLYVEVDEARRILEDYDW